MSTTESSINKLVSTVKQNTQDKALLDEYIKKRAEYTGHGKLGWYLLTDDDVAKEKALSGIVLKNVYSKYSSKTAQIKRSRSSVGLPTEKLDSKEMSDKLIFFIKDVDESTGEDKKVYIFQKSTIDWNGVESSLKKNVITSMYALYYSYAYLKKTWIVLQISSTYRTERAQAVAMVDWVLAKGETKLIETYKNSTRNAPLTLISSLYYNENHLICREIKVDGIEHSCKRGSVNSCKADEQHSLLEKLSSSEKDVFKNYTKTIYPGGTISLKNNKAQMKTIMENWLKASGLKSDHQEDKAVDFGSANKGEQQELFRTILKNHNVKMNKENYSDGNFHIFH